MPSPAGRAGAGVASALCERVLQLRMLDLSVHIACTDAALHRVVLANYEALRAPAAAHPPNLSCTLARDARSARILLKGPGTEAVACDSPDEALFHLEKAITVALQRQRPDLLFLHAAALEHRGQAWLLVGDSGRGKSTTAWGLLHHGFGYLSDELSPIDLPTLQVLAYPHALCLKRRPPGPYLWPQSTVVDLGATLHVPVRALPSPVAASPCPLRGLLFVRHRPELNEPSLRPIARAEVAARLYSAALNALAHPALGLDAVARLAEGIPGFMLESADLGATCRLLARMAGADPSPSIMGHGPALAV